MGVFLHENSGWVKAEDAHAEIEKLEERISILRKSLSAQKEITKREYARAEREFHRANAAERREAELRKAIASASDLVTIEINPSNYDHDDVCRLNSEMIEALSVLDAAIKAKVET